MSQFELIKQGATQSGYAKNEEEANAAATNTLKGALDFWFKSIDPKSPDAANSLNQLRDIGENLFAAGQYELAGDIVQKVNDVQGKVLSSNDDMLVRDLTLDLHNYDVGAIDFTPEEISTKFVGLQQAGMYSDATLNTWYSKYLDAYQRKQEKLLQGDDEIDPMSYPDYFQYEFNNEGKGRDKWIGAAVAQAARDAQAQGMYSDSTLNTWYSKYLDSYQRKQEKLLQGDDEIDPMSYPDYFQYEFNNEGKGRDKWIGLLS